MFLPKSNSRHFRYIFCSCSLYLKNPINFNQKLLIFLMTRFLLYKQNSDVKVYCAKFFHFCISYLKSVVFAVQHCFSTKILSR